METTARKNLAYIEALFRCLNRETGQALVPYRKARKRYRAEEARAAYIAARLLVRAGFSTTEAGKMLGGEHSMIPYYVRRYNEEYALYRDFRDKADRVERALKEELSRECCGNCILFFYEDAFGQGWCALRQASVECGDRCGEYRSKASGGRKKCDASATR